MVFMSPILSILECTVGATENRGGVRAVANRSLIRIDAESAFNLLVQLVLFIMGRIQSTTSGGAGHGCWYPCPVFFAAKGVVFGSVPTVTRRACKVLRPAINRLPVA
jgi:hypothetical protein